jgi:hypothetical protein
MRYTNRIVSFVSRDYLACIIALGLGSAVACSGNTITCAAMVVAGSPAVVITSVTNKQTGTPIIQFTLSNFSISGQAVPASGVISSVPGTNATLVNGTLACSGSCGFGGTAGTYTFTVSAEGRPDTNVSVDAKYTGSTGSGCSLKLVDGTPVTISL